MASQRSAMSLQWTAVAACLVVCSTQGASRNQEEVLHYKIQEQSDVNSFVGNVARDSHLYSRFSQEEFQQLQYSISTQGTKFKIDENTSTIRTGQVLDRELECEFNMPTNLCELEFDVGVYRWKDSAELYDLLMIVHVTVVLEDINDNAPRFPSEVVYLSVPESVPVGHTLLTSGAIDRDTGANNNIQEYRLLPEQSVFRLQVLSSPDGVSSDLGIVVQQPLDREQQHMYQMQVVAVDGGFPQRSGSVNITITVQDVNDNKPTFSREVYNLTVAEDTAINQAVVRLLATDLDSSQNGALAYAFSARTSQRVRDQFAVDQANGDVLLIRPLDYEKDKRLQFVVEVKDHGSLSQQSQATVIVNVADVNDNAPQIVITLPPGGNNIAESIEVGSFIAHVSLSDADSGKNGEVVCMVTNPHFKLEKFSDISYIYKILLHQPLDYEVARQHRVNVSCNDLGDPPQYNSSLFVIHVRDENDNAPIFSKPEYDVSVRENSDPGLSIFQVLAIDPDTEANGNVTYSLIENPESAFSIEPTSGVLRALRRFDRESRSSYRLVVQARDRGTPSLSSSALLQVRVDDVNDNPAYFAQQLFEFHVEEEQPPGTVVDTLRVVDKDDMAPGQLQFSFLPEYRAPPEFAIDVFTGRITTTRPLDRESGVSVYHFRVFVVDAENVQFNDSANVSVLVMDINDHAPDITFPAKGNSSVRLPYTVPAGTIVTRVAATDKDRGENGTAGISYSLEGGDLRDMFLMNGVSGELILTRRLSPDDVSTYHLRVSVQDGGTVIQMTTMTTLDVVVTHSNSSGFFSAGGASDFNVPIVVTLVCLTFALALAVLATICIIRRIDRERKHHGRAKVEEQNIYKQETLAPAGREEKTPAMENYENEIEKLKRKIKRELSFASDDDLDSSSLTKGTTSTFSTFKKTSPSLDHRHFTSPLGSSSVLTSGHSGDSSGATSTGSRRVHYADKPRESARYGELRPMSPAGQTPSPTPGPGWSQPYPRLGASSAQLNVRTEGEDAASHTSASTSDSGRGASSEDDVHTHPGGGGGHESGDDPRQRYVGLPCLSTFRTPSAARPERPLAAAGSESPPAVSGTGLVSGSPRSQSPHGSGTYSRNIGYSEDSATAERPSRHVQLSHLQHQPPSHRSPQQEQQGPYPREESGLGTGPLRGILTNKDRYGTQPYPRGQSAGPGPAASRSLPYRRQGDGPLRQSPPPHPAPPDLSPLERCSGDDTSGLRGKMVNFSLAGESYQLTPRGLGRLPHQSSALGEGERSGAAGSVRLGEQSSVGAPYSMTDMDEVLSSPPSLPGANAPSRAAARDLHSSGEEDRTSTTTTTTSGSYTINANDLCNEIDNLFFNDVVV